ncbi:methyltransferase domain-containing protein [Streptomyces sp. NPDC055663]
MQGRYSGGDGRSDPDSLAALGIWLVPDEELPNPAGGLRGIQGCIRGERVASWPGETWPWTPLIGRLVLGHLPDPVEALRRLSRLVRPGGLVVFQDVDNSPLRVEPRTPLTSAVLQAVAVALTVNGSSLGSGARLYFFFRQAGLSEPRLSATAPMGGAEHDTVLLLVAAGCREGRSSV